MEGRACIDVDGASLGSADAAGCGDEGGRGWAWGSRPDRVWASPGKVSPAFMPARAVLRLLRACRARAIFFLGTSI